MQGERERPHNFQRENYKGNIEDTLSKSSFNKIKPKLTMVWLEFYKMLFLKIIETERYNLRESHNSMRLNILNCFNWGFGRK